MSLSSLHSVPPTSAIIYEFHPYEYGSWDRGVSAFGLTKYMSSDLTNGKPTQPGVCTVKYDNIGYIFGTSSDVFFAICSVIEPANKTASDGLANMLEGLVDQVSEPVFTDLFGIYVNPFYRYSRSSAVQKNKLLTMVDGGATGQNNPIWCARLSSVKTRCLTLLQAIHSARPQCRCSDRQRQLRRHRQQLPEWH